jgi:hypothetical protein
MKNIKIKCYENYPLYIVFASILLNILIYAIGFYIIFQLGLIYAVLYLFYIGFLEVKVMNKSCRHCYYYGKICAFGKGKLCSLFFKKGNTKIFLKKKITGISLLPDFLISLIPIIAGIIILIRGFSWLILVLIVLLIFLTSFGNGFVRGQLACKFCKQRELGCPAEKFFNKKEKRGKNENNKG